MSAEYYECFRFGVRQILFNLAYFRVCANLFLGRGLMVTYCYINISLIVLLHRFQGDVPVFTLCHPMAIINLLPCFVTNFLIIFPLGSLMSVFLSLSKQIVFKDYLTHFHSV